MANIPCMWHFVWNETLDAPAKYNIFPTTYSWKQKEHMRPFTKSTATPSYIIIGA